MVKSKQNGWNFLSLFVYFGLVILVGYLLKRKGIDIEDIKVKELVILTLASYRLTRMVIFEKIFKFFRDKIRENKEYYLFNTVMYIFSCPWCAGVWMTLMNVVFYFFVPYGILLVYILAISGVASLIVLLANLTGLTVEYRQSKRPAHHDSTESD